MREGIFVEGVLNVGDNVFEWEATTVQPWPNKLSLGEDWGNANLLEVICDTDYAPQKDARRSASSAQIYLDGGLMESRCQGCLFIRRERVRGWGLE